MIRLAVIGAGAWGINHVRVAAADPGCELVAVADADPAVAARVHAITPGPRVALDPDDVLGDRSIDAVVIATPAGTHVRLACAALEAGKHILVEKPLAMNLADARTVARAAAAAGRTAMVGHLMLFHPAVVRLRELSRSGQLGSLHYLHSTRVNLGQPRREENALWSFGPHDLSMIDFLVGQTPASVTARGQSVLRPGIEDVVFLTLRFGGGEIAHVHLSWLSPRKERRLTMICSKRMIEFDDVAIDKLKIYDKGIDRPKHFTEYGEYLTIRDGDVLIPQLDMTEPLRLQLKHFLGCIAGGTPPRADLASALRVTAILEAAQRSMARDGEPVVPETELM